MSMLIELQLNPLRFFRLFHSQMGRRAVTGLGDNAHVRNGALRTPVAGVWSLPEDCSITRLHCLFWGRLAGGAAPLSL